MMMSRKSRDKDIVEAKQESPTERDRKLSKAAALGAGTSSRQWSGSSNPRIVRVSRSFGGKDRHSKVCTIRGLRDRRIRLSVPTAIQLYDLQDRLGLSQPSKVIDWLLDATKHDIDQLPPLPLIHQGFGQFHDQQFSHEPNTSQTYSSHVISSFNANAAFIKEVADKGKWVKTDEEDQIQYGIFGGQNPAQKLFPTPNHSSSLPGLMLNNATAYNSEPSALSLSQFGSHGLSPISHIDHHSHSSNAIPVQFPSGSQYFFCPSSTTLPAVLTPYPSYISTLIESDPRQINHIQLLSSSSQHVLPHHPGLNIPSLHSVGSVPLKPFAANYLNPKLFPQSHPNNDLNKLDRS